MTSTIPCPTCDGIHVHSAFDNNLGVDEPCPDCTDGPIASTEEAIRRSWADCACQHTDDELELRPEFVAELRSMEVKRD